MSLYFETYGMCLLRQSRERWSASLNQLDTFPGEKTESLTSSTRTASQQQASSMIGRDTATLGTALTGHHEGWTECFQDLNTWCPTRQDELNTPEIITDGFNFGTIDNCQVGDSDYLSPAYNPLGDDAYLKPEIFDEFGFDEENNNIDGPPYFKEPPLPETSGGVKTVIGGTYAKSPLKSASSNILLTQGLLQGTPGIKPTASNKPTITKFNKPTMETLQKSIFDYEIAEDEENYLGIHQPRRTSEKVPQLPINKVAPVISNTPVQPQSKKDRPKLKLSMPIASNPAVVVMPSTPEVQNVLSEPKIGFDLIKYVVSGDNLIESVGEVTPFIEKAYSEYIIERDHDYISPTVGDKSICVIKDEPPSPFSAAHTSFEQQVADNSSSPNPESPKKRKIKRRSESNSDYIFDSDGATSDDSTEWKPSKKSAKIDRVNKSAKKAKPANRQQPTRDFLNLLTKNDSDAESVASSINTDKYRELRDKNNEASRRSRLNRKARDMEIKKAADKLEAENRGLRARAERMQKLVFEMREIILKTVKGAKKG